MVSSGKRAGKGGQGVREVKKFEEFEAEKSHAKPQSRLRPITPFSYVGQGRKDEDGEQIDPQKIAKRACASDIAASEFQRTGRLVRHSFSDGGSLTIPGLSRCSNENERVSLRQDANSRGPDR